VHFGFVFRMCFFFFFSDTSDSCRSPGAPLCFSSFTERRVRSSFSPYEAIVRKAFTSAVLFN